MAKEISLAEVKDYIGQEVGVSRWFTVDQTMIDTFADATLDHQFIHTDPERARAETAFGGTIAHGFLTLSLLSAMNYDCAPKVREQTMGINFGFDKVRFMAPVKCGKRVRGHFTLKEARFRGAELLAINYAVSIEIEDERKPALTADWITLVQFAAEDRPETA
ncbi:MaoC family dehydratase [Martelella radicis]|uniref:Acyl dehydratase n=1 Tax=Martelella radicis TaxID=1397476 RepID=A0A7W6KMF0_9HYPH|nr:MaoC family dehydratase [Martelella radicis]MBB4124011.1 acyl dehydratase [Martelella radicis]